MGEKEPGGQQLTDKTREADKENVKKRKKESKTGQIEEKEFRIRLLEVQGLNKKYIYFEVEKLLDRELDIVCITEGQNKVDKHKDKKGWGLRILNKEDKIKQENSEQKYRYFRCGK